MQRPIMTVLVKDGPCACAKRLWEARDTCSKTNFPSAVWLVHVLSKHVHVGSMFDGQLMANFTVWARTQRNQIVCLECAEREGRVASRTHIHLSRSLSLSTPHHG